MKGMWASNWGKRESTVEKMVNSSVKWGNSLEKLESSLDLLESSLVTSGNNLAMLGCIWGTKGNISVTLESSLDL